MIFYRVPTDMVTIESLRGLAGQKGSRLNPVEDVNGDWIVSKEEWEGGEFQYLKEQYPDIAAAFVAVDTQPKVVIIEGDPANAT